MSVRPAVSDRERRRRLEACARTARAHATACEKAGFVLAAARAYQAAEQHETMAARIGQRREARP